MQCFFRFFRKVIFYAYFYLPLWDWKKMRLININQDFHETFFTRSHKREALQSNFEFETKYMSHMTVL